MTTLFFRAFLILGILGSICTGCIGDDETDDGRRYSKYTPILMSRSQLEGSIKAVSNKPVNNPGKVFLYGNRIYMTEQYKGVYIIDNTDPSNPVNLGFISIPGLNDAVVKDGVLITDNATDIIGLNVDNPSDPQVLWRRRNALPILMPPDNLRSAPVPGTPGSIVVEWILN